MNNIGKSIVGFLGRVGYRAVAEAVHSVLDDVDTVGTGKLKKIRKAKKRIKEIPREAVEEDE